VDFFRSKIRFLCMSEDKTWLHLWDLLLESSPFLGIYGKRFRTLCVCVRNGVCGSGDALPQLKSSLFFIPNRKFHMSFPGYKLSFYCISWDHFSKHIEQKNYEMLYIPIHFLFLSKHTRKTYSFLQKLVLK